MIDKDPSAEEAEDVVFEDSDEEGMAKGAADKLKELREKIKELEKEKAEYLTGWQKERADFANYKKDEENRKAMFSESVRERILSKFLSVLDSFNMAFANRDAWEKVDKNWRIGVEHIYSQLESVFEEYGVKSFGEEGEPFDPNLFHSIDTVETDDKNLDHKIAKVIQKGYILGSDPRQGGTGRVLRPANVNVYEFKKE
ncbi:MAG TPA: nucleotide exchange factor GrpE [Candidatus Paceibacterota bacterium]|jgi:molecular chaperone GrpE|nr:nucleotide exchange factor GrpE [Candidatus Paceibacterota bacterium]